MDARQPPTKIINAYLVFCIFFFVALAAFLAVRVSTTWGANARETRSDFDTLARESASRYLAAGDFAAPAFRSSMRAELDRRPRLLAVVVYSRRDGIRYAFLRDRELLPDLGAVSWQGSPSYSALPWGTRLYRLPYAPGQGIDLAMDGLYTVVGREDAFPILKEAFVILFAFFVLTCIVLLLAPGLAGSTESGPRAASASVASAVRSREPVPAPQQAARSQTPELFSPATGLGWREHLDQRLKFELERAASFDQDLVLVIMALDDYGPAGSRDVYGEAAGAIRRSFPYQDLTFEYGPGSFALILPDQDIDGTIGSIERFRKSLPAGLSVCSGVSSRNGRLVSGKTLLTEAERALEKARADGRGSIVAFRADPQMYRDVVSSRR